MAKSLVFASQTESHIIQNIIKNIKAESFLQQIQVFWNCGNDYENGHDTIVNQTKSSFLKMQTKISLYRTMDENESLQTKLGSLHICQFVVPLPTSPETNDCG